MTGAGAPLPANRCVFFFSEIATLKISTRLYTLSGLGMLGLIVMALAAFFLFFTIQSEVDN
ncbi:hypothetical protein LRN56_15780, partial [Staphylococcus aureus]|nr:hypothetical protein [Staphylococcus aureus]